MFNMNLNLQIPDERVIGLLCSALEGGSDYWVAGYRYGGNHEKYSGEEFSFNKTHWTKPYHVAMSNDAWLILEHEDPESDGDNKTTILNREACQRGLQLMAEKYPRHWTDFMKEDDDATTGDVFLQLALLGDVVYG